VTEDRDKKNWREADRRKDRSSHRPAEGKPKHPKRPTRASERYRAALDRAFEKGEMGKIAERLSAAKPHDAPTATTPSPKKKGRKPSRQKLMRTVRDATDKKVLVEKLDALLEHYGLPDDFDVLTRALEHPDEAVLEKTLHHLQTLLTDEAPRRKGTLKARLRLLEDDYDTPEDLKELAATVQKML
jgi:hypothetical protein